MPRQKSSREPDERQRFEVILKDVQDKLRLLSDGQDQLRGEMQEGLRQLESKMNGRFAVVEQAIKELHQEVRVIGGRIASHEETHAK